MKRRRRKSWPTGCATYSVSARVAAEPGARAFTRRPPPAPRAIPRRSLRWGDMGAPFITLGGGLGAGWEGPADRPAPLLGRHDFPDRHQPDPGRGVVPPEGDMGPAPEHDLVVG